MSGPTRPIPTEQARAFDRAIADRLGLDLGIVGDDFHVNFTVTGGDDLGKLSVSFSAYLPADEILEMFNGAARSR